MRYVLLALALWAFLFAAFDALGLVRHAVRGGRVSTFGAIVHPLYIGGGIAVGLWLLNVGGWAS